MKYPTLKTGAAALLISALILPGAMSASAALPETNTIPQVINYGLSDQIRVAVKNASVVPTKTGTQLSVTVRLYNGGNATVRVPEHELRVLTKGGLTYTLKPSAVNKAALEPQEVAELVYAVSVEVKNIGELAQISFVNVDLYTYPKTERNLLTLPAGDVWYGVGETAPSKPQQLVWGQSFTIPGINSGLMYTPLEATIQNTSSGKAAVVKLLAENPGTGRESVPTFRIDGVAGEKMYAGQSSETDVTALEAGEKSYLHFVIPLEQGVSLSELLLVSTDTFAGKEGTAVLSTGKLTLALPTTKPTSSHVTNYSYGEPIAIDALSKVIDVQTEVSLMEFHLHENPEEGHKTAVAKFKLKNNSDSPVAMPIFGTEISNDQGVAYRGSRQMNTVATMNPGLSYVVSYSYTLPQTEEEDHYTMKLLDQLSAAPYTTTVAAVSVKQEEEQERQSFSLYPFEIKVNGVQVSYLYNNGMYQYKFGVDMDVKQLENVVVDSNFSKLRFEVVDNAGRIVGTQDATLTGPKKLISGKQVLEANNITTDHFSYPFTVHLYEVIETETGTAKRFLMSDQ
ncbi:hypothetical protein [Paenibacillus turpanensis]|uniref:hypothetical protein n=1 Tax=Paenibacillus turpanensis TaxID=2689078 RepID=UPI00140BC170|nr:hypothetical protein [Paenibacillus turpanensis]